MAGASFAAVRCPSLSFSPPHPSAALSFVCPNVIRAMRGVKQDSSGSRGIPLCERGARPHCRQVCWSVGARVSRSPGTFISMSTTGCSDRIMFFRSASGDMLERRRHGDWACNRIRKDTLLPSRRRESDMLCVHALWPTMRR